MIPFAARKSMKKNPLTLSAAHGAAVEEVSAFNEEISVQAQEVSSLVSTASGIALSLEKAVSAFQLTHRRLSP